MLLRAFSRPKLSFEPVFCNREKTALKKDKDYKIGEKKDPKKSIERTVLSIKSKRRCQVQTTTNYD